MIYRRLSIISNRTLPTCSAHLQLHHRCICMGDHITSPKRCYNPLHMSPDVLILARRLGDLDGCQHGETEPEQWAHLLDQLFPDDEHLASMPSGGPSSDELQVPAGPDTPWMPSSLYSIPENLGTRKRRRLNNGQDDCDLTGESSSHNKTLVNHYTVEGLHWACPFYKNDASSNLSCRKFELKRIVDVRQHLRRHHPPVRCLRCFASFTSKGERDDHIRQNSCVAGRSDITSDMPKDVWDMIALRGQSERGNNDGERRWYNIWEILFPDDPHPESPYVGSEFSERLSNSSVTFQSRGHMQRLLVNYPPDQHELAYRAMQHAITEFVRYSERQAAGTEPPPSETQGTTLVSFTPLAAGLRKIIPAVPAVTDVDETKPADESHLVEGLPGPPDVQFDDIFTFTGDTPHFSL